MGVARSQREARAGEMKTGICEDANKGRTDVLMRFDPYYSIA